VRNRVTGGAHRLLAATVKVVAVGPVRRQSIASPNA